jgi:hypothetical protein
MLSRYRVLRTQTLCDSLLHLSVLRVGTHYRSTLLSTELVVIPSVLTQIFATVQIRPSRTCTLSSQATHTRLQLARKASSSPQDLWVLFVSTAAETSSMPCLVSFTKKRFPKMPSLGWLGQGPEDTRHARRDLACGSSFSINTEYDYGLAHGSIHLLTTIESSACLRHLVGCLDVEAQEAPPCIMRSHGCGLCAWCRSALLHCL